MWIRVIGKAGLSRHVVLPSEALKQLGWEKGDFIHVEMLDLRTLRLTRFDPMSMTSRMLEQAEPTTIIKVD